MHRSAPGWSIFSGKTGTLWRCIFPSEAAAKEHAVRCVSQGANVRGPVTWESCQRQNMLYTVRVRVVSAEDEDD